MSLFISGEGQSVTELYTVLDLMSATLPPILPMHSPVPTGWTQITLPGYGIAADGSFFDANGSWVGPPLLDGTPSGADAAIYQNGTTIVGFVAQMG